MTGFLFGCAVLSAAIEWAAVFKGWRRLEYVAKPAVMAFLFAWFMQNVAAAGLQWPLIWFGAGILLSLTGDIFLLLSNERRWFLFGLGAFLLAHIAYILGLNTPLQPFNGMTFGVAVMVGLSALPVVRRILFSMSQKRLRRLVGAVRIYAAVISLTLFSALMTLFRVDWLSTPAYLASGGALLLVVSDMVLGWNKFVHPVRRGRLVLMISYHLGQMALIAGAVGQFARG
jgi:uncharacterized membrane protein YhhN